MIVALRRLAIVAIVVLFVLIAAVLGYGNQEPIDLDIGIVKFENVSLTLTLAITFVCGAAFGGLFAGLASLRSMGEKRVLRRQLRRTETEVEKLRSLPLHDAD